MAVTTVPLRITRSRSGMAVPKESGAPGWTSYSRLGGAARLPNTKLDSSTVLGYHSAAQSGAGQAAGTDSGRFTIAYRLLGGRSMGEMLRTRCPRSGTRRWNPSLLIRSGPTSTGVISRRCSLRSVRNSSRVAARGSPSSSVAPRRLSIDLILDPKPTKAPCAPSAGCSFRRGCDQRNSAP
jgi:hypothetical protein